MHDRSASRTTAAGPSGTPSGASGEALRTWIVTDGKVGMLNQCLGLADALGVAVERKTIELAVPWRWLPPAFTPSRLAVLDGSADRFAPPWPGLLIASGRKSVPIARAVRRAGGGVFCVQIQDPGVAPGAFDLVIAPEHDGMAGPNVLSTLGSLHGVNDRSLANARARFASRVADLPRPLVAVLIGGDNAVYGMTDARAGELVEHLRHLAAERGYGLAITPSRRTPAAMVARLHGELPGHGVDIWDGKGDNPYLGFLGLADAVVVTSDSVNMVSEAAATGKPVHVFHLEGGSDKFTRFHDTMTARGITRPFAGAIGNWTYTRPDDTARAAAEIRRRMAAREAATPPGVRGAPYPVAPAEMGAQEHRRPPERLG